MGTAARRLGWAPSRAGSPRKATEGREARACFKRRVVHGELAGRTEYNARKNDRAWLEEKLSVNWFDIAVENGLVPAESQCVGWKLHPLLGGKFW